MGTPAAAPRGDRTRQPLFNSIQTTLFDSIQTVLFYSI
jgi:hypothetical protein